MEPSDTEALVGQVLVDEVDAELDAVEAALGRLDDGAYGVCARCGRPLPEAALEDDPLLVHCPEPCGA